MSNLTHKYYVIGFAQLPNENVTDYYTFVPRSWIRIPHDEITKYGIHVLYPNEDPAVTVARVKKKQPYCNDWQIYEAEIEFGTDSYEEAESYVTMVNLAMTDRSSNIHRKTNSTTPKICSNLTKNKLTMKQPRINKKQEQEIKATKCINLLQKAATLHELKKGKFSNKISSNLYQERQQKVSTPAKAKLNKKLPSHDIYNGNSNNKTVPNKRRRTLKENNTRPNNNYSNDSLNSNITEEDLNKLPNMLKEMATSLTAVLSSTKKLVDHMHASFIEFEGTMKSITEYFATKTPDSNKKSAAKLISAKEKNEKSEADDFDDSDSDNSDSTYCEERPILRRFVLPKEYNPKDSSWTLKHQRPLLGLVELEPGTGVLVDEMKLRNCKRSSKDGGDLARKLLMEVFSENALKTCSLTGAKANFYKQGTNQIRPGLDETARMVLMNYVADYGQSQKWPELNSRTIMAVLRSKIQSLRYKR